MRLNVPISVGGWARLFTRWELLAILLILGLLVFLAEASRHLLQPLAELQQQPLSLDPAHLPEYAARTTLRMFVALGVSLLFTFTYATLAAKSQRAERLLVPMLDILQSVPILGFLPSPWCSSCACPRPRARRRIRGDLRDLHQPGLEHGVQLLPVAAHRAGAISTRPPRSFQLHAVACASGGSRCRSRCPA